MKWSPQQVDALKKVDKWFYQESKKKQVFRVFGYAGTGKTTLAMHFAGNIDGDVLYAAFTGKAADVMRKKGCHGARTIHSLIYIAEEDKKTGAATFHINKMSSLKDAALLIIDECSMVDEALANDILSFGRPVLVLGDPAQLPPVDGAGYFTEAKPDVMLTEIHRQARDNPIVHLATMLRNKQMPDFGTYGESSVVSKISTTDLLNVDQVLVGRNATRNDLNSKIRKMLKLEPDNPVVNDKLICLANDKDLGIFNGGLFRVEQVLMANTPKAKTNFLTMRLETDDEDRMPIMVRVHKSFFNSEVPVPEWRTLKGTQRFDWGYVLSCHKAQGSQWNNTLVYDESWCFREDRWRWAYTAITRAAETVKLYRN